jgi:hypothetical protein
MMASFMNADLLRLVGDVDVSGTSKIHLRLGSGTGIQQSMAGMSRLYAKDVGKVPVMTSSWWWIGAFISQESECLSAVVSWLCLFYYNGRWTERCSLSCWDRIGRI